MASSPTSIRPGTDITRQAFPSFLPDGRTFLYVQESSNAQRRGVFLGSLDSPNATRVLPEPANAVYSSRGYLLYGRQGTVFAHRFDAGHKRVVGEPLRVGSDIDVNAPFISFAIAGDVLVWANGSPFPPAKLMWFDRNGKTLDTTVETRRYYAIALAPDQRRVVSAEGDPRIGVSLFMMDLTRPIPSRLTTGERAESDPVWSPDSREVAFNSDGGLFTRRIDQEGRTTLLADGSVTAAEEWTRDGQFILFGRGVKSIWALPLGGGRKPVPVIQSSSAVDEPRVSRDGRWLTYSGNDTGQWEVYLQPFLRPGSRVRVSTNGGSQPRWRGDGSELFYLALDGAMMSVRTTDPTAPGAPRQLFKVRLVVDPVDDQFDVTADGQRFLVVSPEGQQTTQLTVLSNWPSMLKPR